MARSSNPDFRALLLALFAATVMIAQQVAGKAMRDALFLSNFDVTNLPKVVSAAAIASMASVLLMSYLLSRINPITLVPAVFGLSAVLFVGEWSLLDRFPGAVSVALYLHMAVFGAILISGFWSIINERFDPHSAKQRVARIAAAAALGGVIGGVLANRVSFLLDVRSMLLFLSGLHLVCLLAVRGIGTPSRPVPVDTAIRTSSAFTVIRHTSYLQWMAALMVLIAIMAALLDYSFKAAASARYQDSESLVSFFATFYAAVGVLGFTLQTLLGRSILQKFGIGATITILPGVIVLFGTIGALFTHLWSMVLLRGSQAIFANSLFRSAFELLYTPIPPHKKRPTKTIIDVASDRVGDLLGSGLILLLLFLIPGLPTAVIVAFAVGIAGLVLFVISRLNQGYINQLARSLRKGVVRIEENDIVDATTRQILAEADTLSEKDYLQTKISAMRERRAATDADVDTVPGGEAEHFARAVADLRSNDPARIQHALDRSIMDLHLTPWMIPLLANDAVADDIRTELRWLVPRIIGQLTDAMLDPDLTVKARQRLPGVLEASHNPRSIDGLLQGLADGCFNVRFSSARALARMRVRNKRLKISRERIFAAIRSELASSQEEWDSHSLDLMLEDNRGQEANLPSVNYSIEHVFTLLTLTLDPDAVRLSMKAAFSEDINLRGTALEYLENVLPADLYNDLAGHIARGEEIGRGSRTLREVIRELKSVVHATEPE
jgi:AAA family ATP:ADP antiporter